MEQIACFFFSYLPSMPNDLTLEKILSQTELPVQHDLALVLLEWTLPLWEEYAKNEQQIDFYDGVGNHYSIEKNLLQRTVETLRKERAENGSQAALLGNLYEEFIGPILCINRMDWEPPYAVDRAFCAAYNFLQLYLPGTTKTNEHAQLNLVINQAADALMSGSVKSLDEMNAMIGILRSNYRKGEGSRTNESVPDRGNGKVE